jgi:prepilin-type N-terminal cleavage/methylation domain-containing protein
MNRRFSCSGFTFVEFLITLFVLCLLAAVIVPNVSLLMGSHYREDALFTVYVTEDGVRKQIADIVYGEVEITLPKKMYMGKSGNVKLTLIPPKISMDKVTVEYKPESFPEVSYEISQGIHIYTVMSAELKTSNFNVSSDASYAEYRAVSMESPNIWRWVLSPNSPGDQTILFEMYAPIHDDRFDNEIAQAVFNKTYNVHVSQSYNWGLIWAGIGAIGTVILAGVGVITLVRRRQKKT